MNKKIILAYSGGLDTSIILQWLIDKNYEVICYVANVGQEENWENVVNKAKGIGASKVYVEDLKEEFVEEYIFPALQAHAIYDGSYLLGTALARPLIAKKLVETAKKEDCSCIAHGATGKGNDQIRFELSAYALQADIQIIAPWRDPEFFTQFSGRKDLINYAKQKGIPVSSTLQKPYSMDANLMHISYEAGSLEDPSQAPKEDMYLLTKSPKHSPDSATQIAIEFESGIPVSVKNETDGTCVKGSLALFEYLNDLGKENGIGRIDIVETRFVGMKSRGVYETPAGTILMQAHIDLERLVLDREVFHLKEELSLKMAKLIYNGLWFTPEKKFLQAAFDYSQKNVKGIVKMELYKGNASIIARSSPHSLYNNRLASMDELGDYNQSDAEGFIKIQSLRLRNL